MDEKKQIAIDGFCEVPQNISIEEFNDIFVDFIEQQDWYFCGLVHEKNVE